MFEDRVAFDSREHAIGERKIVRVRSDVHARQQEQIDVYEARRFRTCASYKKVPTSHWKIARARRFRGIANERNRWLEPAAQPLLPAGSTAHFMKFTDTVGHLLQASPTRPTCSRRRRRSDIPWRQHVDTRSKSLPCRRTRTPASAASTSANGSLSESHRRAEIEIPDK